MSKKQLNEYDKRFLDAFFTKESFGDYELAKELAGYPETTPLNQILDKLADEIKERTIKFMALNAPRAAITLVDAMTGLRPVNKEQLKAGIEVLDRGGVVKREHVEVHHEIPNAVIIVPAKDYEKD